MADVATGGCRDGLHSDGVNQNQGAESTLAWLHSLLRLHEVQPELAAGATAEAERRRAPLSRPAAGHGLAAE